MGKDRRETDGGPGASGTSGTRPACDPGTAERIAHLCENGCGTPSHVAGEAFRLGLREIKDMYVLAERRRAMGRGTGGRPDA